MIQCNTRIFRSEHFLDGLRKEDLEPTNLVSANDCNDKQKFHLFVEIYAKYLSSHKEDKSAAVRDIIQNWKNLFPKNSYYN